ncbi:MAG TPA: GNAT family N-acetyltransferase [Coriobacteriia bacterium]|jgi:predicted acetyltransferase
MGIRISHPDEALREAFLRMLDDYDAHDPLDREHLSRARAAFGAYVKSLNDEERGLGLPAGFVPCSHRWLVDEEGEIVGVVRVRHTIDHPFLAEEGGHIGYDVPPARRGRGHGTAALRAGLARARELGLTRVLGVRRRGQRGVVQSDRALRRTPRPRAAVGSLRLPDPPVLDRSGLNAGPPDAQARSDAAAHRGGSGRARRGCCL